MANKGGVITRKDIITDEALTFGETYAKNLQQAIDANEILVGSVKELNTQVSKFKTANTQKEYITAKQEEKLATLKATEALKIQQAAELSLEKVKRSSLDTEKQALDLESKKSKIKKENANLLIEEAKLNQQLLKSEKEEAILQQQLTKLEIEKQKVTNQGIQANGLVIKNLQEEEKLLQKKIATTKGEFSLMEQKQRIIKNGLDIKAKELAAIKREEDARLRLIAKTPEEIVNQSILARNAKNHALANSKLATEYEKLTAKTRLAATAYQNILLAGRKAGESQANYNARLRQAQKEFEDLNKRVIAANRAIGRFNDNVGNYPLAAAKAIRDLVDAFGLVTGIQLFVSITKQAFEIIKNFEAEIVNLAAIAGKSREEIAPLEAKIREVSKVSINGATDVAKLATELIKLGATPEEVEKLLQPIDNLSVALKATAEDAAGLVKGLLNAYGEGVDQAARYTDVLAEAANRSALDFQGLRDSFSYLAPTARTLGLTIEQTAAILGVLVDNNIKAESAGRLTATAFGRLADQGLTYEDALKKINAAQTEGKSKLEILSIANKLFGAEAGKIGIILANNTEKVEEATVAYNNSAGALQELTDKQLKSVSAELAILDSSWEDYILNTNDAAGGTKAITSVLRFLSTNLDMIIDGVVFATGAWAGYRLALILANLQSKLLALTVRDVAVAQTQNTVVTGFGTTAQVANAAATTVATTAWERFNAALKANALGIIIGVLVFLIATINSYSQSLAEATKETFDSTNAFLKNRDAASKNNIAISTLSDRYDELKGKSKLTKEEQIELNKIIEILAKTVPGAVTEIDKYGDAMAINTTKTREFTKSQRELFQLEQTKRLKENIALLSKLSTEQKTLTINESDLNSNYIEGIGYIRKRNGNLEIYNKILGTSRALSLEEQILFKKKVVDNEKNLSIVQQNIKVLSGMTAAEKEAAKAKDDNAKKAEEASVRTIGVIDAEIKALEDSIETLSDKSGKEGQAVKKKIAALKAERELIYSTEKADKKFGEDRVKRIKAVYDAIYQLSQFRYSREIEINQKILDDEKRTVDDRLNALYLLEQIRASKNDETLEHDLLNLALEKKGIEEYSKKKLEIYIKDAKARIENITSGKIAVDKMTNEEKLIIEKYMFEKKKLEEQGVKDKQATLDAEVALVKKKMDEELQLQDKLLNEALEFENKKFLAQKDETNYQDRQKAIEEHERQVYEIKKRFALDALKVQMDSLQALLDAEDQKPEKERVSAQLRKQIEAELAAAKKEYSDIELQAYIENAEKRAEKEAEVAQRIRDLSYGLKDAIVDLTNAILSAKIQSIDDEITAEQEKYDQSIKAAGDDQRKKDLLTADFEKKKKALEDKKRQEQRRQAIFNKVISLAEIGINTAVAISKTIATLGLPLATPFVVAASVIGALQAAAVLATPIPKYKFGRKDGPEELAYVGDGGKREVIERASGGIEITPATATLVKLEKHDKVHSSIEEYARLQRAASMASINMEGRNLSAFQANQYFESAYGKEVVQELKLTRKAIEKIKVPRPQQSKSLDFNHELFRHKNTNWRS